MTREIDTGSNFSYKKHQHKDKDHQHKDKDHQHKDRNLESNGSDKNKDLKFSLRTSGSHK
jgi:hypothetical protein